MQHLLTLTVLIFVTALVYSSVGHAGASGYLAAMALMNVSPDVMKPTALCLNIIVATIGTIQFARAGHFAWKIFWPFAATSIPFAALGGATHIPSHYYKAILGAVLLFGAFRLVYKIKDKGEVDTKSMPVLLALLFGAGIGFVAGLTGVGGGIFLSPLLLLAGWSSTRQTAGVSVAFILVNSISGLAGNLASVQNVPFQLVYFVPAAAIGGLIGSHLGSRRLAPVAMRYLLALVLVLAGLKMLYQGWTESAPKTIRPTQPNAAPASVH
jgi:uncharacterized protein